MKALIDTNILIDFVQTSKEAAVELGRYEVILISRITWMEFLIGARTTEEKSKRELLLDNLEVLELDPSVAFEAIAIRQKMRIALPDAIILATARVHGLLLVTRNHRDFPRREPDIRIPYKL